ncbi:MAG: Paenibacillus phage HB10c2 [Cyanobacteriota bacterium]|jgi:prophage antirepressor-like protein
MNDITISSFNSKQVRAVKIDGEHWFVAKDLCQILEISKHRDAISRLDDDERGSFKMDTPGGKQEMAIVSESGMYALVLSSRKPEAKVFRKWVTSELLPTLRKTGSYNLTIKPKSSQPVLGAYIDRVHSMVENSKNIPQGYWCVLQESANLLIYVETVLKMPVDKADLLDGSIGSRWSKYREGKDFCGDRVQFSYKFPDGREVKPWAYQWKELEPFRRWLEMEYTPKYLPEYLSTKYGVLIHSRVA